ncbi:hypothetical protein EQW78_01155 [Oerskovia turbata]|uniref:Uncharacterized protein n=1 Tax=Oerskovia turbata TaxID=1713 RepID=A0A4Q1L1X4_9CELL|nr:hypothetical protein [Oerskovia turbata]RXR26285.1 hypothetical protein EQW73_08100 [Oerskovia turbata]RXR36787.1 hypothetical protein EQW78_01155 [Oerskovia turbata]
MILADLQLTRVLRAVGAGRGPLPPVPPSGRYVVPGPDGAASLVRRLVRRAGHPEQVADRLVDALATLRPWERAHVLDPLHRAASGPSQGDGAPGHVSFPAGPDARFGEPLVLGSARAVQLDGTTCGSAVLAVLAAAGDPVVGLWLVAGTDVSRGESAHVVTAGEAEATARELETSSGRFAALQRLLQARTAHAALGPLPWPTGLGTPPWTAARDARYADVRYTHRIVAGHGTADRVLASALRSAAAGVPVPLYAGGDLGTGWSTAVPRHVVLLAGVSAPAEPQKEAAVPFGGRWCSVYEPSTGTMHRLRVADLLAGTGDDGEPGRGVRRALGGWPHVTWAVLPAGRAGGSRRVG